MQLDESERTLAHIKTFSESRDLVSLEFPRWARNISVSLEFNVFGLAEVDTRRSDIHLFKLAFNDARPLPGRGTGSKFPLRGTIAEFTLNAGQPQLVQFETPESLMRSYPGISPKNVVMPFISTAIVPTWSGDGKQIFTFVQSRVRDAYDDRTLRHFSELTASQVQPI